MKGIRTPTALVSLAALGAMAACGRDPAPPPATESAMSVGAENVAVVRTDRLRTGPELSGTLTAEKEATVVAEVGGAVLQTYAEEGQQVRAGQTLARIDRAGLDAQTLSAESGVATAEGAAADARRDVERTRALYDAGAIPQRDVERARSALTAAEAQLASARSLLANAREQVGRTTIAAPFSGVVSERSVSAGDVVTPGSHLYTVVDPATLRLEAFVTPEALASVRVGKSVDFTVSGYPQPFVGRVTRVNPVADPTTRQVRVIVSIPNTQGALVGGLFASGRVATVDVEGPVVPTAAVDESATPPVVVRIAGGRARRTPVELGTRDGAAEAVAIRAGLAPGDTVLLGAAREITEGTPVRVEPGGPTD